MHSMRHGASTGTNSAHRNGSTDRAPMNNMRPRATKKKLSIRGPGSAASSGEPASASQCGAISDSIFSPSAII